jgi:putative hydrolase of the HAD superfamily
VNNIVVFDLGRVLVDFDYNIAAHRIAAHSDLPSVRIKILIEQSSLIVDYESGRLNRLEFFNQIRQATGFRGTLDEFGALFADVFTPIPPMIELHAKLHRQGLLTYILSNTNDLAVGHIRRNFPFFRDFDGYLFSHEIGIMKPDARIYEALEKLSRCHGAEIIYLDDLLENVKAGTARGWRAILHESPEKSWMALEDLGML